MLLGGRSRKTLLESCIACIAEQPEDQGELERSKEDGAGLSERTPQADELERNSQAPCC